MRASVTDLDQFLYWKQSEDMPIEELIGRLRKLTPPSPEMYAGIALHSALETATDGRFTHLEVNGLRFIFEIEGELQLPEFREVKAEKVQIVRGIPVTLVGKVDALHGRRVDDHKTTSRLDFERYFAGYQWRYYLDIFDADRFRWNVFEIREDSKEPDTYIVHGFHQAEQARYPGMADDCAALLDEFVQFAQIHLPERFGPITRAA